MPHTKALGPGVLSHEQQSRQSFWFFGSWNLELANPVSSNKRSVLVAANIQLQINGAPRQITAEKDRSLLSVLRDDLLLAGCKYACGEGECGACTVIIDGRATRSCITPIGDCDGKRITTVEGLETGGKLHPVQQAFLDAGAMQCGYCTTGMIMNGVALLDQHPRPTREQIIEGMNGNVCRCGTYSRIIAALQTASQLAKGGA
jgi:aerobic-type carbon monoxide dehydrogenase small subunit (CoxS/CutS family)